MNNISKMSSGWNFNSNKKKLHKKKKKWRKSLSEKDIKKSKKNEEKVLTMERLNCGPAGRNTLIRWIEYNYQLKRDEEARTPAINACKVWQKTQSFQDLVLSGLVDFLKFLNVPKHITYRSIFENYLSPIFIGKVISHKMSQQSLIRLAKKMLSIFQVREMQPILSQLLDKIDIIPISILNILTESTPSAEYFYEITSMRVKRKIWVLRPQLFYEEVEGIIDEIIIRMKINGESEIINKLILQIVEFLGDERETNFLYNLCVHIIRLKSLEASLIIRENYETFDEEEKKEEEEEEEIKRKTERMVQEKEIKENNETIPRDVNYHGDLNIIDYEKKLKQLRKFVETIMNPSEKDLLRNRINASTFYSSKYNSRANQFAKMRDNRMHERKNRKYYLSLSSYFYNSSSFHYLKKKKEKEIYKCVYKLKKDDIDTCVHQKNENANCEKGIKEKGNNNSNMNKIKMNPQDGTNINKIGEKRNLSIEEKEGIKKIKININSLKDKKNDEKSSNSSNINMLIVNKKTTDDIITCRKSEKLIYAKNSIQKETDSKVDRNNEKNDSKRNANEYCQNKTMLSFDFDNMFYSNLRMSLCLQYKERYKKNEEEMLGLDKYYHAIEFVSTIIKKGMVSFQGKCTLKEFFHKAKKYLHIKTLDDLYEYSLLFNNLLLKFVIIEGVCSYFYKDNFNMLTVKDDIKLWITFFYFGVYNNFIALIKYAFDKIEQIEKTKKNYKKRKNTRYNLPQNKCAQKNTVIENKKLTDTNKDRKENLERTEKTEKTFEKTSTVTKRNNILLERKNKKGDFTNKTSLKKKNCIFPASYFTSSKNSKKEVFKNHRVIDNGIEVNTLNANNTYNKESFLKIPLLKILNYIAISNNKKNVFFSFFCYLEKKKRKAICASTEARLQGKKEKNTILLLATLLNLPQLDCLKIKNLFFITEEFVCIEKQNILSINNSPNVFCTPKIYPDTNSSIRERKGNYSNEVVNCSINNNSYCRNNIRNDSAFPKYKEKAEFLEHKIIENTHFSPGFNYNTNDFNVLESHFSKSAERNTYTKEENSRANIYNQLHNADNEDINLLQKKNMFDEIGKRFMSYIKDISSCVGSHEFLSRHKIDSIYFCEKESDTSENASHDFVKNEESVHELKLKDFKIPSMNHFCNLSNKLLLQMQCQDKIRRWYFPYVLKICYILLQFLKKKKLLNIYRKDLHLYGYFYHMTLSRILFISTVGKCRVLQNYILRELHSVFEEFKNVKDEKKLWKFYLYAHTLIDINHTNNIKVDKLFHNQVIDYFIKLFYYLSFYNVTFAILFLKILKTPLFFKHVENKRGEILQNLWKGIHERSSYYFSKHKEYSIEYKIWMDLYNEFSKA